MDSVAEEVQAEYQQLHNLTLSLEELCVQYHASHQEILATYDRIHGLIQSLEDLNVPYNEEVDNKAVDDKNINTRDLGEDGLENAESAKDIQRASCEIPGPSHISSGGVEYKTTVNTTEEIKDCSSKESSSSSSCLEETPEEIYVTMKSFHSGSSDDTSDFFSLEEETPQEL
ncbi:uncharacterized protein [Eleutherodactylus coqui]|uniref:uncharacterized protein n=1 Tax=Eleutherodactylus coqui TaxID=57060 RepID=UPI0034633B17